MLRRPKKASTAPSGSWTVASGSVDGQRVIVRFDRSYQLDNLLRSSLPYRVGVALPFNESLRADDHNTLADFEDTMESALSAHGARLVAVITRPTVREFVLHSPDAGWASDAHIDLRHSFPNYDVQMYAAEDADWVVYSNVTTP